MFGTKSEKIAREVEQLELKLEELETGEAARPPAAAPTSSSPRRKRQRRPLPEHLPRETHTHMPAEEACTACGGQFRSWVRMSPRCWNISRPATRSSATYVPRCAAPAATRLCRPRRRAGRSSGDLPDQACWPMFSCPSMQIIFPCIASQRYTLAKASTWIARRWPTGSELPAICFRHWSISCVSTCLRLPRYTPMTRPFRCWHQAQARPRPARLWTYVRDDRPAGSDVPPAVWFTYSEDRKGEHPKQHLSHFCRCTAGRCLCWLPSSLRRRQDRGSRMLGSRSAQVLRHSSRQRLSHCQRGHPADRKSLRHRTGDSWLSRPRLRYEIRQTRARPLIEELHLWFHKTLAGLSRKSDTAAAIRYALSRWRALSRYLDDGSDRNRQLGG